MSAIRDYLLSVEPDPLLRSRGTHPEIVALARAFVDGGGSYDDEAERYIEAACGDLPAHHYHGHPERDPLTHKLGTAIYNARCLLDDERATAQLDALRAEGYQPLEETELSEGAWYLLRRGTLYVGRTVPVYGPEMRVRAARGALMAHRARTRAFWPLGPALIKQVKP